MLFLVFSVGLIVIIVQLQFGQIIISISSHGSVVKKPDSHAVNLHLISVITDMSVKRHMRRRMPLKLRKSLTLYACMFEPGIIEYTVRSTKKALF